MSQVERALDALRRGEMIVVTDDPHRENEGDLILAAEFADIDNINFMASKAKGLICMPMSQKEADRLQLDPMVFHNTDNHETAFTVSIDHVDTTTGISAEERALTARKAADPNSKPMDFRRPGHMFPLIAKAPGVLEREGHTEATVDLLRLAGMTEVGICCEIMADNGQMLRGQEVIDFAQENGLVYLTIEDLKTYRKINDKLVEAIDPVDMPTKFGHFTAIGYEEKFTGQEHVALVKGDIGDGKNLLVRVHSECLTGDSFGSLRCDCGDQLAQSMRQIEKEGRGIVLYMRQEGRGIGLINKLKAYNLQDHGYDTVEANVMLGLPEDARDYYIGAQILKDLGVKEIRLLTNNPHKIYNLSQYDMKIVSREPIEIQAQEHDHRYLHTKAEKMNHILEQFKLEEEK